MKTHTEYLYSFSNASLTLKVIEHLRDRCQSMLNSVAVINLIDRWLIKIKLKDSIGVNRVKNLQAFLNELGFPYQPTPIITIALARLEIGESPVKIMNRYKVVIVAYGKPEKEEIEIFREQIVEKLGYCPQNMA
ncbi:conserved hypothetical protein [Hyella patelloides LEGE 07179]|uniref:Uncharacterized protein n=1 Tax=Hyella patelloides LEGE 07179 TaxID=945734 RepID=A0A563VMS3_9CYAN|nr:hypothetical protein [Hyella patelloides]VEP12667.1 conserved hypothetical protein [Hyella patelloides LEGE 07179]